MPQTSTGLASPSARRASPGTGEIEAYLAEVRRYPLLPRDEQRALARRMVAARESFRARALALPETARALVALWRERQAAGRTTATLSAHHFDRTGDRLAAQVDEALGEVERLLGGRARRGGRGRPAAPAAARIARRLAAAELAFEAIVGAFRGARGAGASEGRADAEATLAEYERHRDTFVRHNLRLVVYVAKRYVHLGVPLADLVQEGNLGLIRAVEKFDAERGLSFSTYAAWWLHQSMIRAVQKDSRTVRTSSGSYELQLRCRRAEEALRSRLPYEPARSDIAACLGLSADEADRIAAASLPVGSLHAPLPGTDSLAIGDVVADEAAHDPVAALDDFKLAREIPALLDALDARERAVVEARFGLHGDEEQTLREIGRRLGLSRERVRQIECAALGRMRRIEASRRPLPVTLEVRRAMGASNAAL